MFLTSSTLLTAADPLSDRIERLPEQTLMELLIADLDDRDKLRQRDGFYGSAKKWKGVHLDEYGLICEVQWSLEDKPHKSEKSPLQPGGLIDLQFLPHSVEDFAISNLGLNGTVEALRLPRDLRTLIISHNFFEGTLDLERLPRKMKLLHIHGNRFEGTFDLERAPKTLTQLYANHNRLSGSVDLMHLSVPLCQLRLHHNKFSGRIDMRNVPSTVREIQLHQNSLRQDLLVIGNLHVQCRVFVDLHAFRKVQRINGDPVKVHKFKESFCIISQAQH